MKRDIPLVDPSVVLGPAAGVGWVTIGDEVVVHRVDIGRSLVLDSNAGLLWKCLDGTSRLGEILDDIADAFGVDRAEVEDSCAPIVETWLADKVVEEVNDG